MMDLSQRKEQFSVAYVRAVASVAGCDLTRYEVDDDKVDLIVKARVAGSALRSARLDVQLKCTAQDVVRREALHFPLEQKNYDELIGVDHHIPRILVVVVVPQDLDRWLDQSEEALSLRRCGYWYSLRDLEDSAAVYKTTVRIPRHQVFSVHALTAMMQRIAAGEEL